MNKKGQTEVLFLFIFVFALVWIISSAIINSNPYKTYMDDCKDLNKNNQEFSYNSTCSEGTLADAFNGSLKQVECQKIDYDKLDIFCQNKWDGGNNE